MLYKLAFVCLVFLFSSIIYLINIKIITNTYNYTNFWWITLMTMSGVPIFTVISCVSPTSVSYKKYWTQNIIRYPLCSGILYSFESMLLYYSITYVPLSTYMILRSSFIIWNIRKNAKKKVISDDQHRYTPRPEIHHLWLCG